MLDSLGPELLALVCEFVNDASPNSLVSVALTSKYMNYISKLALGRHMVFNITGSHSLEKLSKNTFAKILSDKAVLGNLRTITIQGRQAHPGFRSFSEISNSDPWSALANLVADAGRLRCLIWNISHRIPASIIQTLETHQRSASLRVLNYLPPSNTESRDDLEALCRSPNLTVLRANIRGMIQQPDLREANVQAIIAEAPNLQYASCTRRHADEFGHAGYGQNSDPEKHIPAKPNSSLKSLALDGYNINKQTLDEWAPYVDFSRLENLKMTRGFPAISYFNHAASALSNLQHISLNFRLLFTMRDNQRLPLVTAAREYLKACNPVKTLSLWSWMQVVTLDALLDRHGSTVISLQLHEREEYGEQREVIGLEGLQKITQRCVQLTDLTFDINPSVAAPTLDKDEETLKQLEVLRQASGQITRVQMYFDILQAPEHMSAYLTDEDDDEDDEEEELDEDLTSGPIIADRKDAASLSQEDSRSFKIALTNDEVMQEFVREIWGKIFGKQRAGRRLLEVKVGEYETAQGNKELNHWAFANVRQLVVSPEERDDRPDKCTIKILKP